MSDIKKEYPLSQYLSTTECSLSVQKIILKLLESAADSVFRSYGDFQELHSSERKLAVASVLFIFKLKG